MEAEKATIIDAEATVEGRLEGKDARILGRFKGEVAVSGSLVMGSGSKIDAKVEADTTEIAGEFTGELVSRHLVLMETAQVSGTVDAQTLAVHEGAVINGPVSAGNTRPKAVEEPKPPAKPIETGGQPKPDAGPGTTTAASPGEDPE